MRSHTTRYSPKDPAFKKASLADFAEYQQTRDPRLRDRLVDTHSRLAYGIARRFAGRGEEMDDLRQVALLALVQAVERFDPSLGIAFSTFAAPSIAGSVKRHFRDRTWAIRPPRSAQDLYLAVTAAEELLTGELSRMPTAAEIAAYGGWSEPKVHDALAARMHRQLEHWGERDEGGQVDPGMHDERLGAVEERLLVEDLLSQLGDREREIVKLRYFDELTQSAIGQRVRVSQTHVSRILASSLDGLRVAAGTRFEQSVAGERWIEMIA